MKNVMGEMRILNIGATAIGTAINVDPYYLSNISYELSKVTGIPVKELVLEEGLLKEEELKEILRPEKMTQPAKEKVMKAVS